MEERKITIELEGATEIDALAELLDNLEHNLDYEGTPIVELVAKLRLLLNAEVQTLVAPPPYDVKSVDATQVSCANRLFHDNPGHIPKNYGEYTDPLVGDQFGADGPPVKKTTTENRPKENFGQPFLDD